MKKRLLLFATAAMTAMSGFALGNGDFVYTKNGRYRITDSQSLVNIDLQTLSGFSVISANAENTATSIFSPGTDAEASVNYIEAIATTTSAEGLKYKLPISVGSNYVLSLKIKSPSVTATHNTICKDAGESGMNKVVVYVTRPDTVFTEGGEVSKINEVQDIVYSDLVTLNTEWTTYAFAITEPVATKENVNYYVEFSGMTQGVQIGDIELHEAEEVADLRIRDKYIKLAEAYINGKYIPESALEDSGVLENYDELKKIGDESSVTDLLTYTEAMESCLYDINGGLCSTDLDNWLGTYRRDILGPVVYQEDGINNKMQKAQNWGIWTFKAEHNAQGRLFAEVTNTTGPLYVEGPHGGGNYAPTYDFSPIALETTNYQEFTQGSYVFTVEMNGSLREKNSSNCWDINFGLDAFYGQIYLLDDKGDTIKVSEPVLLHAGSNSAKEDGDANLKQLVLAWDVEDDVKYKVGMQGILRDELTEMGGTVTFANATLYYKATSPYKKSELNYIDNVKEQIKTGRDELTKADEYLNNTNYKWGKSTLQACVDTISPKIANYEATLDTTSILATFDPETYVNSTEDPNGALKYTIYQEAVKDILAANRKFVAVNDSLNMLTTAIATSKELIANRIFDSATEEAQLSDKIAEAEQLYTTMASNDYSEENVDAIEAKIVELSEANNTFKNSIPSEKIVTFVDIDFANDAVTTDEGVEYDTTGGPATITGAKGTMTINNFMTSNPLAAPSGNKSAQYFPYQKGIEANDAVSFADVLRVGQGDGVVDFDLGELGTNIVKVSMDWYFGRLSGCFVGFYLNDENTENVSGLYFSPYDANNYSYNPLNVNNLVFAANTAGDAGFITDNNKTSMQLYLDYGTNKAQIATQLTNGSSYTSDWVDFSGSDVKSFVLRSNYNYAQGRRCWFDNLKIEVIQAGDPNAVAEVKAADAKVKDAAKKVVNGQLVIETAKGTFNAAGAQVK